MKRKRQNLEIPAIWRNGKVLIMKIQREKSQQNKRVDAIRSRKNQDALTENLLSKELERKDEESQRYSHGD